MNLIITIIIVLLFSYLFTLLGKKIRIPIVVSLILSGLILGHHSIKGTILEPNIQFINNLGDIALICLMFLAGLESSWRILYSERKDAVIIALFAAVVPFLLGFVVFNMMGFSTLVSSIVGICMSITAEATKARVLLGINRLRTRVGSAMMGAGIVDDILGLSLFILISYILKVTYLRDDIFLAGAIIAFFIGAIIPTKIERKHPSIVTLERILLIIIIPFFFISMGMHFDLGSLLLNPSLALLVLAIAVIGKLAGTFLTKPFTNFSMKQLTLIGWGMNSRGAVELALVMVAFRNSLIPVELYSSLIMMALVTTLIFPFVITRMIKKNKGIMR